MKMNKFKGLIFYFKRKKFINKSLTKLINVSLVFATRSVGVMAAILFECEGPQ